MFAGLIIWLFVCLTVDVWRLILLHVSVFSSDHRKSDGNESILGSTKFCGKTTLTGSTKRPWSTRATDRAIKHVQDASFFSCLCSCIFYRVTFFWSRQNTCAACVLCPPYRVFFVQLNRAPGLSTDYRCQASFVNALIFHLYNAARRSVLFFGTFPQNICLDCSMPARLKVHLPFHYLPDCLSGYLPAVYRLSTVDCLTVICHSVCLSIDLPVNLSVSLSVPVSVCLPA